MENTTQPSRSSRPYITLEERPLDELVRELLRRSDIDFGENIEQALLELAGHNVYRPLNRVVARNTTDAKRKAGRELRVPDDQESIEREVVIVPEWNWTQGPIRARSRTHVDV